LIRSADRITGTNTNFQVQLQKPIRNLKYAEWVSSTVGGLLVIDKFPNASLTTNGTFYWRNLLPYQNGYYSTYAEEEYQVANFSVLNVSVQTSDSAPVEIELDLYCESD